jgi:hypothetical protein
MLHKLRTAVTLSAQEWRLFWQAWLLLLLVDLRLRRRPFPALQRWAAEVRGAAGQPAAPLVWRTWRMVDTASRNHLYAMTCLRRSLVLQRLLGQQGITVELRFGVKKVDGMLRAHAWLEHQGQPVGEPQSIEYRYAPLWAYPALDEYPISHE